MSKAVKAVVGVGAIVAGVLVPGLQSLIAVGASLTLGALSKGAKGANRQAAALQINLGEGPRQAIFGMAATAGTLLDGFNYGGKYGTSREVLVIALADHRCQSLEGFYVNDQYVTFAGNGTVAGFDGKLKVTWYAGTATQTADPTCTANGGWTADDRLLGVSYVVVEYLEDGEKEKNPTWPSGRPSFLWVVKGALCYDSRKDSTVPGGSGPHRWDDPTTREWSENLIVCRYTWARGLYACDRVDEPGMLLIGRGLTAGEAPPERVAAPANLCDEMVDGEPRYRVSAVIGSDEQFLQVEQKFAAACAGVIIQPEGSVEIEPGHAKSSVASFTDADLIVGRAITFSEYRSEADEAWVNTVAVRYNEPSQKWADHGAPVKRVDADVIADGGPRVATPALDYVAWSGQAQRVAEITRRMGRLWRTGGCTLGPRFCEIEEGDWVTWTSSRRTGGQPVKFRVESFESDEGRRKSITLREIATSVFTATEADPDTSVAEQQTPPDPAAYVRVGAASFFRTQSAWPLTSTDTTISIAAFTGTLDSGEQVSYPSGSITGLTSGILYAVVRPYAGGAYFAEASPAQDAVADAGNVIIGYQYTTDGGVYTPTPPPPPGGGGSGGAHVP